MRNSVNIYGMKEGRNEDRRGEIFRYARVIYAKGISKWSTIQL